MGDAKIKAVSFPSASDKQIKDQVEILEKVLAEAKRGVFETLLIVGLTHDGLCQSKWTGAKDLFMLLAHLARLQHQTQRRIDNNPHDD